MRTEAKIVMSVPHSGTRSLVEGGISGEKYGLAKWWHFHYHDDKLERNLGHNLNLQIPIRDPMLVAASWHRRSKDISLMLKCYESMFRVLDRNDICTTLHRTSELPMHLGAGDGPTKEPEGNLDDYLQAILTEVLDPHLPFFERYA